MVKKNYDNMLSRFHSIPKHHGRTDKFAISITRVSILTRDKKTVTGYHYKLATRQLFTAR